MKKKVFWVAEAAREAAQMQGAVLLGLLTFVKNGRLWVRYDNLLHVSFLRRNHCTCHLLHYCWVCLPSSHGGWEINIFVRAIMNSLFLFGMS